MNQTYLIVGIALLALAGFIYTMAPQFMNVALWESTTATGYQGIVLPLGIILPIAGIIMAGFGLLTGKRR